MTTCPVCHYFQVHEWEDKDEDVAEALKGKDIRDHRKDFINIEGNFTIKGDYYGVREVSLKACPECHCIIMFD